MITSVLSDPICRAIWSHVDHEFYLAQNPDVREAGLHPVVHYAHTGWKEGRDPSHAFSTTGYLRRHTDVRESGANPLQHYVEIGFVEGREVTPFEELDTQTNLEASTSTLEPDPEQSDLAEQAVAAEKAYQRSIVEPEFNARYYLGRYPDVEAAGTDPLDHYMEAGWIENRDPNPFFSTENYLELNEDVRKAGINPLFHYLVAGKKEGRIPKLDLGFRYDILRRNRPLSDAIAEIRRDRPTVKATNARALAKAFETWPRSKGKRIFLSASHDDFTRNFGGVQLVLMREAAAIEDMGIDHIHIFPSQFLPTPEMDSPDPLVGVLKNGGLVGHFKPSAVAAALNKGTRPARCDFAVHSLLGHSAEGLAAIVAEAGGKKGWFWIHDYASVCSGYNLLRNDVEFCHAPPSTSAACGLCRYGPERDRQVDAHRVLFERFDMSVVSPSEAALNVWTSGTTVPFGEARVLNHATLPDTPGSARRRRSKQPLKVGFLGLPVTHKGWPVFRELVLQFGEDPRYEFYHLGSTTEAGLPLTFEKVEVRPGALTAMSDAVARLDLDLALIWSIWPETYCLTAYEAMSAGAGVIATRDSGNVADMVQRSGFGAVLDDEAALTAAFADGSIQRLAGKRPVQGDLTFSRMTADLIGKGRTWKGRT